MPLAFFPDQCFSGQNGEPPNEALRDLIGWPNLRLSVPAPRYHLPRRILSAATGSRSPNVFYFYWLHSFEQQNSCEGRKESQPENYSLDGG